MNFLKQLARRALGSRAFAATAPAAPEAAQDDGTLREDAAAVRQLSPGGSLPHAQWAQPFTPGARFATADLHAREASNQPAFPPQRADGAAAIGPARRELPQGLMDLPPLRSFLAANHFGLGRHNGSHFRTAQARDHGVRALVAEFQSIVATLCTRVQAHIERHNDALLQAEGVCETTTRRLRAAVQRHERELATLREQLELADRGEGWVRQALASYQLGFAQGLQAAMDAEHLGL
ncbi:hypothetical protein [uncultured Azohydromonas sp.]|jgi:hypothetical protein|uniref:hypothetical protein n=1 Tax=uncultured Azohydromonas sp. TaxID=487342 RepID=UPI00261C4628|nr:hypothetical protein [uncultured Azohydromonas sp.]